MFNRIPLFNCVPDISNFALKGSAVILSFKIGLISMSIDVVLATFKDNLLSYGHTLDFPIQCSQHRLYL